MIFPENEKSFIFRSEHTFITFQLLVLIFLALFSQFLFTVPFSPPLQFHLPNKVTPESEYSNLDLVSSWFCTHPDTKTLAV